MEKFFELLRKAEEQEALEIQKALEGFCSIHETFYTIFCPECSTLIDTEEEIQPLTENWGI